MVITPSPAPASPHSAPPVPCYVRVLCRARASLCLPHLLLRLHVPHAPSWRFLPPRLPILTVHAIPRLYVLFVASSMPPWRTIRTPPHYGLWTQTVIAGARADVTRHYRTALPGVVYTSPCACRKRVVASNYITVFIRAFAGTLPSHLLCHPAAMLPLVLHQRCRLAGWDHLVVYLRSAVCYARRRSPRLAFWISVRWTDLDLDGLSLPGLSAYRMPRRTVCFSYHCVLACLASRTRFDVIRIRICFCAVAVAHLSCTLVAVPFIWLVSCAAMLRVLKQHSTAYNAAPCWFSLRYRANAVSRFPGYLPSALTFVAVHRAWLFCRIASHRAALQ